MTGDERPTTDFPRVAPQVDLPALESSILDLWDATDAFPRSVEFRDPETEYTFYDGPPFPTGSPHYGNLLAGVIKDIVPRYWTMRGHRVERRFGWDTHGLPIEMEVQRHLGLSGPREIEELGVARFNEACRTEVETNTETWEYITRRLGRWIDFENDYRTMDVEYMESVWWVFRGLWDRGLVYQDFKVVPYSWAAGTPLSNFELNLGGYRDVEDPSITVRLQVTAPSGPMEAGDWLLIWTTTPWTLPGNLAVAVGRDITYERVVVDGEHYWVAAARAAEVFDDGGVAVGTAIGSELLGASYEPPFEYFAAERERGAFRVIPSPEVKTDEGTGLVHMAPAYGEADFAAMQDQGLDLLVDPVDLEARFTEEVPDVAGVHVKEADAVLIGLLRDRGLLLSEGTIVHAYPFCWRTETPLIYKAIPSWYVAVETFKDRMADLNDRILWVPEYVGRRRFGNWLRDARDWAVSRNRFWGSCIPVWICEECDERLCIGSRAELEELSGVWLDDLHKQFVDEVTFPCTECEGTMRRIPEVLDVWFESGSMPYAKLHYPFENEERFSRTFPADFIAEGLDQTRGWFYTLVVLATALFDDVPFDSCVVNGMILAEDGRKMSKSLKNYPDPSEILDTSGADALRTYLINSPVLRAEPLLFSIDGVRDVVRTTLLPLWNAFSFFTTYAAADGIRLQDLDGAPPPDERAEIDRWILSVLQSLIRDVNREMERYRLYAVIPPILQFIDDLTNWYIRRSRRRFWRQRTEDDADKLSAFATLYEVLVVFARVAAPVLPFMTEELYQRLVRGPGASGAADSVHHTDYPFADDAAIDEDLERDMAHVRSIVTLGRSLRRRSDLRVRQPLASVTVVTTEPRLAAAVERLQSLIADELNVRRVAVEPDESRFVSLSAKANFKTLGPRLGARVRDVAAAIALLGDDEIAPLLEGRATVVAGQELGLDDIVVAREPREGVVVAAERGFSVALDTMLDEDLIAEGLAREVVNRVQTIRKDMELDVTDRIEVSWHTTDPVLAAALRMKSETVAEEVLAVRTEEQKAPTGRSTELDGRSLWLLVSPHQPV
ncbi:MAG: isoleucine--tRNA ligase [Acidimicrobiia bacterium]